MNGAGEPSHTATVGERAIQTQWTGLDSREGSLTSVLAHEGSFDVVRGSTPHADWLGVVIVHRARFLVEAEVSVISTRK